MYGVEATLWVAIFVLALRYINSQSGGRAEVEERFAYKSPFRLHSALQASFLSMSWDFLVFTRRLPPLRLGSGEPKRRIPAAILKKNIGGLIKFSKSWMSIYMEKDLSDGFLTAFGKTK